MNSVAIPASAPSQALSAEADLARAATRGDSEAFGELFRRHSQPAWRLAQAVAPGRDASTAAFRDGFSRAARSRRAAAAGGAFRPEVLAAVYKAALEQAQNPGAAPSPPRRAPDPGSALADAAFRSLPERWRAALWLSDVEGMDVSRISPILGVSSAVATQLVTRGRRGLAGRFAQARHQVPEHLGQVLRTAALDMPADLAEVTQARWAAAGSERSPMFAPVAAWMEDHAIRPASVAVGTLVGLGLIGLGVIPQGSPVRSQLGASGAGSLGGAVPVQSCLGLPCSGTGGQSVGGGTLMAALGGGNPLGATLTSASGGTGGLQTGGGVPAGSGSGGAPAASGPTSLATGSTGTGTGSTGTGTGGSGGGSGGGTGGGSPLPSPTTTIPSTTLNLAPVATVSSGSSLDVTLLPSSPLSTTVTVPLSTTTTTSTTTVPSTTTTTTPLSGVTTTVNGTLSGVTNTVTSTATTLLPGL